MVKIKVPHTYCLKYLWQNNKNITCFGLWWTLDLGTYSSPNHYTITLFYNKSNFTHTYLDEMTRVLLERVCRSFGSHKIWVISLCSYARRGCPIKKELNQFCIHSSETQSSSKLLFKNLPWLFSFGFWDEYLTKTTNINRS